MTEENSVEEKQEKLKIVIRLPDTNTERMMSFPFLHALYKLYSEAKFHFVTLEKDKEIFSLLPFSAFMHTLTQEECEKAYEGFRVARADMHMRDIDLYFGLSQRFHDAFFGFSIQAKKRYGLAEDMSRMMYTRSTPWVDHNHPATNYFKVLSLHTNASYYDYPDLLSKDFEPVLDNPEEEYFVVNLSLDASKKIDLRWEEFLTLLNGSRVFAFLEGLDDEDSIKLMKDTFASWGLEHVVAVGLAQPVNTARLLQHAKLLFSLDSYLLQMACYLGTPCIGLFKNTQLQKKTPLYFGGKITVVSTDDLKTVDLGKVFDEHLHNHYQEPKA